VVTSCQTYCIPSPLLSWLHLLPFVLLGMLVTPTAAMSWPMLTATYSQTACKCPIVSNRGVRLCLCRALAQCNRQFSCLQSVLLPAAVHMHMQDVASRTGSNLNNQELQ